jgi:protoheme IX farnesyltransferase
MHFNETQATPTMSETLRIPGEFCPNRPASNLLSIAGDFLALTRPRILMLVILTAPAAMAMGRDGWPDPAVLIGVIIGTALIGGGCGALNAWIERERDAKMTRTMNRPLPTGRLSPRQALVFGLFTSAVGLGLLLVVGGGLCAAIGALTLLHYIFVYTLWLKPRSPQNIVIGGAAGATAPLIADAAVSGTIGLWSLVLFAIIFLWTPPHFWAIALYRKDEYAAAGFPMMPVVVGDRATRKKMWVYASILWPVTLIPWIGGALGPIYGLTALVTGGCFVASIARSRRIASVREDRRVFAISIAYLALLFAVMILDLLVS